MVMAPRAGEAVSAATPDPRADASLRPPPLRKYQVEALEQSRDRRAFALFLEMGLGKTRIAIETALHLADRGEIDAVLVIAPKGVYRNWSSLEIPASLPAGIPHLIAVWDASPKSAERRALDQTLEPGHGLVWLCMNVEGFSSARAPAFAARFLAAHRAMLVVDESTSIKAPTAARTKAIVALRGKARYRRILTGSPVTKSPLDLYAPCALLGPELLGFGSYYAFRNRHAKIEDLPLTTCAKCHHRAWEHARCTKQIDAETGAERFSAAQCAAAACTCTQFKQHVVKREVGYQRLDELQAKLTRFSYRATKDELDLPPKIYVRREVELTPEQGRVYREMAERARVELASGVVDAKIVLTKLLRLNQIVCGFVPGEVCDADLPSKRIDALLEAVAETSGKVIVWAPFRHSLRQIAGALAREYGEAEVRVYDGETASARRPEIVAEFQHDAGPRFFVGEPRTGGYGITLTAASTVVYFANSFSLEVRLQSEDRAHRLGQTKSVTYVDLVTPQTIDEKILASLREKKDIAGQVLGDGWRAWI